jgi:hypothetical protein
MSVNIVIESSEIAFGKAIKPYTMFHQKPWWEVADVSKYGGVDTVSHLNTEEQQRALKEELTEGANILDKLFTSRLKDILTVTPFTDQALRENETKNMLDLLAKLVTVDSLGGLLGMFNVNNISMTIASPIRDYFLTIDQIKNKQKIISLLAPVVKAIQNKIEESDDEDSSEK